MIQPNINLDGINNHFAGPKRIGNITVIFTLTTSVSEATLYYLQNIVKLAFCSKLSKLKNNMLVRIVLLGQCSAPGEQKHWHDGGVQARTILCPGSGLYQNRMFLNCYGGHSPCHATPPQIFMQVSPSVFFEEIAVVTGRISFILSSVGRFAATSSCRSPAARHQF
jgi:hypothetical protein